MTQDLHSGTDKFPDARKLAAMSIEDRKPFLIEAAEKLGADPDLQRLADDFDVTIADGLE